MRCKNCNHGIFYSSINRHWRHIDSVEKSAQCNIILYPQYKPCYCLKPEPNKIEAKQYFEAKAKLWNDIERIGIGFIIGFAYAMATVGVPLIILFIRYLTFIYSGGNPFSNIW